MHRWFRFSAVIALIAFAQSGFAQDNKVLLAKIDALTKLVELQSKQIETLNADLTRLTELLLERTAPKPAVAKPAPTPVVISLPPVTLTPPILAEVITSTDPVHVIKQGETLTSIARQHSTTVAELIQLNKIEDERKLQVGQKLLLPKPTPPAQ